ncbi:MAG: FAD-dependent oxidoreductase [Planctomycetes bacterium]|nr:FAD-dependent oxidoreductase [Planctomycetota bacterium]
MIYDAVVVGGGFYGCMLAVALRRDRRRVLLLEKHADIMQRASYANQARVHQGYHYPRSLTTALRSRVSFARFAEDFPDCIDDTFQKYYAVPHNFSKVTAAGFRTFCERIGAPLRPAPRAVRALFEPAMVEEVFAVEEFAFNAVALRRSLRQRLADHRVEVRLNADVQRVAQDRQGRLKAVVNEPAGESEVVTQELFNCTYSQLNQMLASSGLPLIPLKHELAEMALVAPPDALEGIGITLMCGPFFSCMPFPPRRLHTLSHVRYTPHCAWQDGAEYVPPHERFRTASKTSQFGCMLRDAARYVPVLKECRHVDSLWEVKTVLPASERDDSRPILWKRHHGFRNLHCILGGKIDNVYDVLDEVFPAVLSRRAA